MRKRATATEARIVELEATNAELAQERDAFAQERDSFARQRDALVTELATTHERAVAAERERDLLRASHERLRQELELLKKRLYVAKAERVDTTQLEMEFAAKLRELEELAGTLEMREEKTREKSPRSKPKGRRDLRTLGLPEDRVEIPDPVYEALVAEGKAVRHGFEASSRLMRQRGGMRVVVTARVKYKRFDEEQGKTIVATAARPKDLLDGTIMTASLGAHIIHQKVGQGMPLFRLEDTFAREGVPLDRSTMSRMMEAIGATFGATVVYAMRLDAMVNAFCIATDATGLKVLPKPRADKKRQACKMSRIAHVGGAPITRTEGDEGRWGGRMTHESPGASRCRGSRVREAEAASGREVGMGARARFVGLALGGRGRERERVYVRHAS
jgi:transposase